MAPNWKKFQHVVHDMINNTMGADPCIIKIPSEISYDLETGETFGEDEEIQIKSALIPTNKDDLADLPEGYRDRVVKKIFTIDYIPSNAKVVSEYNNEQFEVISPSVAYRSGNLTHCYRTLIAKIETTITGNTEKDEEDDWC